MPKTVTIEHFMQRPAWWTSIRFEHPVYLAFQGGGARGISHVGGLAAVDDLGLRVVGVAGTSAGAIIAALAAAHYKADDLLNPRFRTHLLQTVAKGRYKRATSLFSDRGWWAIKTLRDLVKPSSWPSRLLRFRWLALLFLLPAVLIVPQPWLGILLLVTGTLIYVLFRKVHDGLASLQNVRDLVNTAIAERLHLAPDGKDGRGITFRQMRSAGGLPLKLVATNVTDQALELFSRETTPEVVVADAVAASICLPFIFKPWSIEYRKPGEGSARARQFLDGGLMSNLPAWSFDEERALRPDAVTIAFGLTAPRRDSDAVKKGRRSKKKVPHWFFAALNTIVAGPPELHFRGIDRLVRVQLESKIKVLDFDASFDRLSRDVSEAKRESLSVLLEELTLLPRKFREYLEGMRQSIVPLLANAFPGFASRGVGAIRITVAIQRATDHNSMAIAYEVGHRHPPRRPRLSLDPKTMAGAAWWKGGRMKMGLAAERPETIYPDSAWAAAVPIAVVQPSPAEERLSKFAVVAIFDSADPLPVNIRSNHVVYDLFHRQLYSLASVYFILDDFGRTCRRSVTWIG
jgi:NTE family protein